MWGNEITLIIGVTMISVAITGAAFFWVLWSLSPRSLSKEKLGFEDGKTVFLFKNDTLVDASSSRGQLDLDALPLSMDEFVKCFEQRFPKVAGFVRSSAPTDGPSLLLPREESDAAVLICEKFADATRFTLSDAAVSSFDRHMHREHLQEALLCRRALEQAPYPVWKTAKEGDMFWRNQAYQNLAERYGEQDGLFNTVDMAHVHRQPLKKSGLPTLWFILRSSQDGLNQIHYAIDVSDTVRAEEALRNFIQTLTKTFAQLSIGLAIFDSDRQLALFNPALVELTQLPAEFLSGCPHLLSVFDRLRDNGIMPEPKDYKVWREKLENLVAVAAEREHSETWNLSNGTIYRVSGRPHTDGAIAFLFEDISSEVSQTRKFRAELEFYNSIVDSLEQAIAVFSASGRLILTNPAYESLWGDHFDERIEDVTIIEASRTWQRKCEPSPIWGDLRDFVLLRYDRERWDSSVFLKNGGALGCVAIPITGGASLIVFDPELVIDSANLLKKSVHSET